MNIVFGPVVSFFNGNADDGDSSNGGPGRYQGSVPGGAIDGSTSVYADGPGSGAPSSFVLSARADGRSTSNGDHAPEAVAYANVIQAFSVVAGTTGLPLLDALVNWLFPTAKVTASISVTAKVDLGSGIGDVTVDGTIIGGPAGGNPIKLALTHTYHVETNPASAAQIDVSRDGALLTTISNPGIFTDHVTATAALPPGSYLLDLSLKVSESFDGHAGLLGIASTQMAW
jgi:hypothetical protein